MVKVKCQLCTVPCRIVIAIEDFAFSDRDSAWVCGAAARGPPPGTPPCPSARRVAAGAQLRAQRWAWARCPWCPHRPWSWPGSWRGSRRSPPVRPCTCSCPSSPRLPSLLSTISTYYLQYLCRNSAILLHTIHIKTLTKGLGLLLERRSGTGPHSSSHSESSSRLILVTAAGMWKIYSINLFCYLPKWSSFLIREGVGGHTGMILSLVK